jgi:hypothetical protein
MTGWQLADLAPGLYVAALAWGLDRLLRRLGDPVPARIWAAIALLVTLFVGPALFGGRVLLPLDNLRGELPFLAQPPTRPAGNPLQGDLLTLIAPLQVQVRAAWSAGRWPLWNAALGAGLPLLGDPQAQALQPLALVALPFGVARAAAVLAALRLVAALVFGFLFFRRLGLRESAAAFGAVSYGIGGFLGLWLGWPIANAAALLPCTLWAVVGVCAPGRRRDAAALVAALAALLLGGQPEAVLYALAVAGAFAALRLLDTERARRAAALRRLGACSALALGLAAPGLAPALELLPRTLRAADRAVADPRPAADWDRRAVSRWLPIAAPNAFGNGRYGDASGAVYWGESNTNEDASGFAGTLTLMLALAALGVSPRVAHPRFAAALLLGALFLLAPPAFATRALDTLPLWRSSATAHHRLLMVVNLALAWLGACGLESAARGALGRARILAAAALVGAVVAWATLAHAHPVHPAALAVLRLGWLKLQGKLLVAGALLALAAPRLRVARALLCGLLAGELLLAHVEANPSAPKTAFPPPSPALAFVAAQPGSARMAALDDALPANLAALWGLADARLYDPAAPAAYARLVRPLGDRDGARPQRFRAEDHPLYDALAVRYLLAEPERALHGDLVLVYAEADAWIWERPGALEIAALVPREPDDAARLAHRRLGPQRLQAAAVVEKPRALALSILQDGNWRLLDGGERLATRGPLVAARLAAGAHQLELLYRPATFLRGLLLAALAATAALAWLLPPPARPASIAPPPPIDAGFRRKMAR